MRCIAYSTILARMADIIDHEHELLYAMKVVKPDDEYMNVTERDLSLLKQAKDNFWNAYRANILIVSSAFLREVMSMERQMAADLKVSSEMPSFEYHKIYTAIITRYRFKLLGIARVEVGHESDPMLWFSHL